MIYENYHKHSHRSNIYTPDTHIKNEDYCKRAVELGHKNIYSTEHGYGGDIFEMVELAEKYNLNPIYAVEGYIVNNAIEKDNSNYHIVIVPKNDKQRKKLNKVLSHANTEGYYYKPRIFVEDLLSCDKDAFYITTACCGGLLKNKDSFDIFLKLYNHFGNNIFLETQTHLSESQKKINQRALIISKELGLKIIHANDSHYIYPQDSKDRLAFLNGKNINYGEEDEYVLDYPSYEEILRRYDKQGVLTRKQAEESLKNTLIFSDIKNIHIDKTIKMPNIYKGLDSVERLNKLKDKICKNFEEIIIEDKITYEEKPLYVKAIREEMKVIEDTISIHTMDYFLLNERIIDRAINVYGGVLTTTSRGSAGAYYLNRLLGITQLDRVRAKIPLYYERFMSSARLLGDNPPYTSSLPDCDFNVSDPEPFIKATKDLLGENGCKWMLAYGTMQEGEAFRNTCRSKNIPFNEFNEVAKDLDKYREDKYWGSIIEESKRFVDVIVSASAHPCSNILFDGDLEEELGVLKIGEFYCCPITSSESDNWKYLKNDYLTVSTVTLTKKTFDLIGIPRMSLVELENALDEKVWDIYAKGLTCTVNQIDSDWATQLMKIYKCRNVSELAMFTGCIRPNFNAFRDMFIHRKPFHNKYKVMDDLFKSTNNFILFQENLMQFFEWLGVKPNESIGIIKKISKKKIKQKDFDDLTIKLKENWFKQNGTYEGFEETWKDMQPMMAYGYNSPHGLAMAYDSLYGAYLKAHYTYEYYCVALDMYNGDAERTNKLTEELEYFDIKIKSPRFGYSKSNYLMDKENHAIYKGISSIKFLNAKVGDELYELSQQNRYNNFLQLLKDIKKQTSCNSKQLDILIKLDFFEAYGGSAYLLKLVALFDSIYNTKQFSKSKITDETMLDLLNKYSNKITSKLFKEVNTELLLKDLMSRLDKNKKIDISDRIKTELEFIGNISYTDETYDNTIMVATEIKINRWGTPYVKLYRIMDGHTAEVKVNKQYYNNKPLNELDTIKANIIPKKKKRKIDGKWQEIEEEEFVLNSYGRIVKDNEQEEYR